MREIAQRFMQGSSFSNEISSRAISKRGYLNFG